MANMDVVVQDPAAPRLATALTVQTQLDNKRTIIAQTYIDRDATQEEYNATLDKLNFSIDRQEARYELIARKRHYEAGLLSLKEKEVDLYEYENFVAANWKSQNKKGIMKLSGQEANNIRQKEIAVRQTRLALDKSKQELDELEAKLAGGTNGSSSAADSHFGLPDCSLS